LVKIGANWHGARADRWLGRRARVGIFDQIGYAELGETLERILAKMQFLDRLSRELPTRHARYIANVSDSAHAISLELARFILEVASEDHAKRLLDLGSGFSSYVLREYAAGVPDAVAWSVDDDPAWLEKTHAFLVSEGLSTEHLYNRSEFLTLGSTNGVGTFDLVVHDLSTVRSRHGTIQFVLGLVRPGGALILDDMDVDAYRRHARSELDAAGAKHVDVKDRTLDARNRYSWLARPTSAPGESSFVLGADAL
jgi:predicted O-methyltransferase YrrM